MPQIWKQVSAGLNQNAYRRDDLLAPLFLTSTRVDKHKWDYAWSSPTFGMGKGFKAKHLKSAKGLAVRGFKKGLEELIKDGHPKSEFAQVVLGSIFNKAGRSL